MSANKYIKKVDMSTIGGAMMVVDYEASIWIQLIL